MSDQDEPADRPTPAPFLGALVIIVIVITAIFVFNRNSGGGDAELIGRAVSGQNDALQRQNYQDFLTYTCAGQHGTQAAVLGGQRNSVAKRGERYVDGVGNVVVNADRATAKVTYHFKNDEDTKVGADLAFVKEDGTWKVCSPGPA
ncbi:lumazine-binding protein [Mycolicibacterium sp. J2]|uniref:Rv0361 family membrane protein n=1 Tax=Mycolicibacterium sp. J2 TaxID=2993511 RepID=UPI00224B3C28|nr:lumazine-binding protein [Mycolicibacterium sp. J2]MCX2710718.1 lumazine-binding protein [Mycolicibacterium sp. J2]